MNVKKKGKRTSLILFLIKNLGLTPFNFHNDCYQLPWGMVNTKGNVF